MATGESKYVLKTKNEKDEDITEILEEGHVTSQNITSIKFAFNKGIDITSQLDKRNAKNPDPDVPTNTGRTGFAGMTVKYPDGEESTKATLTNCVIQYRESMFKDTGKDYGSTYINLGIPKLYLDTVFSHARLAQIRMENKEKTREKSGYYWVDCDIRKLQLEDIWIIFQLEDDESYINTDIRSALQFLKSNIQCTVTVSISGSITNRDKTKDLPLETGTYHPSIKLHEVILLRESDVQAPDLSEFASQAKKETAAKTEKSFASGKLLEMAMARLKMG